MKKEINMTSGTLWDKILIFALPLAATSILQQLFNSADTAIVGRFAGSRALAAVGSNGPVINLLVNIFVGISIGANVIISRFIGEGNKEKIAKAVHTAITVAIISGLFVTCLGTAITRPILELMSAPKDIIDLSAVYLRIYFLGMPFMMLYNFSSAILRSKGDTRRPLISLLISGSANVILNIIFVIVFGMGVAGVAAATVISQMISAALLLYFLMHEEDALRLVWKKLSIDRAILKDMAKIGVPAGLQSMVFSASNIIVQSSLNSLGSTVLAASSASVSFEIYAYYMLNAFEHAAVTFTGQNYGAGNLKRCARITRWCLLLGFIFTGALSVLCVVFGSTLIKLYTADADVAKVALMRMNVVMLFQVINMVLEVFSGAMRGLGYSLVPTLISIFGICGVRVIWVAAVFRARPEFMTLVAVYPLSWCITASAITTAYFIVRRRAAAKMQITA